MADHLEAPPSKATTQLLDEYQRQLAQEKQRRAALEEELKDAKLKMASFHEANSHHVGFKSQGASSQDVHLQISQLPLDTIQPQGSTPESGRTKEVQQSGRSQPNSFRPGFSTQGTTVKSEVDTVHPAVLDTELKEAFMGTHKSPFSHLDDTGKPRATQIHPSVQPIENQFSWILAIGVPNPAKVASQGHRPISREYAEAVYCRCFKGEETFVRGSSRQHERHDKELNIFIEAFDALPTAIDKTGKAQEGRRPFGKQAPSSEAENEVMTRTLATCYLDLIRNTIISKIAWHCGLPIRCCLSEDQETILILVTAELGDLLREADRQAFPAQLDVRNVDPVSLEPCTKTFYPLLDWYFCHHPVKKEHPLNEAYKAVLAKVRNEPEELRDRYAREVAFWEEHSHVVEPEDDEEKKRLKRETSMQSPRSRGNSPVNSLPLKGSSFFKLLSTSQAAFDSVAGNAAAEGFFKPEDHIGSKDDQEMTAKKFLRYLQLKAEAGLNCDPLVLMKRASEEVNLEHHRPRKKKRLKNLYGTLGQDTIPPYRCFEIGTYGENDPKRWEWQNFTAPSRKHESYIDCPFSGQQMIKLTKAILDRQMDLDQLIARGLVTCCFPLDSKDKVVNLKKNKETQISRAWRIPDQSLSSIFSMTWAFLRTVPYPPSIHHVRNYYGERVSMYFALVQTMCKAMAVPAVIGILTYIFQTLHPGNDPQKNTNRVVFDLMYAISISAWGTVFLEIWKRRQITLAVSWGQSGIGKQEIVRPSFVGVIRRSPIDFSDTDQVFPDRFWGFGKLGRLPRQIISFLFLMAIAAIEVVITIQLGVLRHWWADPKNDLPLRDLAQMLTGIMTSSQMAIFGFIGKSLSRKLNDWENWRCSTPFVNALITKIFMFEFVNRFVTFFYVAFLQAGYEGCLVWVDGHVEYWKAEKMDGKQCLYELQNQAATVLMVEMFKNAMELMLPWLLPKVMRIIKHILPPEKFAVDEEGNAKMSHFVQLSLEKSSAGGMEVDFTFDDYLEVMILFGYVVLFSTVFPLAPLFGMLLLLVESRVDGLKVFEVLRRPLPVNAENIGNWILILQVLTWMSMVTNSALIVWTLTLFDGGRFGDGDRPRFFLLLLLFLICFKAGIALIVPDVPTKLQVIQDHHTYVKTSLSGEDRTLDRKEIIVDQLDLTVESAESGQLRDPCEFGLTKRRIQRRVHKLEKARRRGGAGGVVKQMTSP